MSLSPGSRLANFLVVEPIGEGGMGVVWRATDTTLGRDVAIKVLPDLFASDPERMARFEREARLLASLNHPHIASIFGLHAAEGVRFLAMELVAGEDLSLRIARGPLPLDEALPLALQIAQALEHAHERGVVHRDLKPANIKLSADGQAKVLDFGLAKALEGEPSQSSGSGRLTQSPTITGPMTAANVLLGTAAYMAPEQARGLPADRRADIWAFGVVVMEMLTGRRLFEGETISDTLASVLRSDIDPGALPKDTPKRVRTLIRRCLERDHRKRLRDIGEARVLLEEVLGGIEHEPENAPILAPAPRRGLSPVVLAALGLAAGAVATFALLRATPPPRADVPLVKFRLGESAPGAPSPAYPAISPDGRMVAWLHQDRLIIQSLGDYEPREIRVVTGASRLFWAPDSREIGYIVGTRILKVPVTGGESQAVCDTRGNLSSGGGGASWREDGIIVFSRGDTAGILQVPAMGGDPTVVVRPDTSESDLHEPHVLPGQRGILFAGHHKREGIDNISLFANGKRTTLLELPDQTIHSPVYSATGHILFGRTPTTPGLWAVPFSLDRLAVTGTPFLVTPNVREASVSRTGTLVFVAGTAAEAMQLTWLNREGKEIGAIGGLDPHPGTDVAVGPDGQKVAHSSSDGENTDIWIYDTARGTRTRLTFEPSTDDGPAWSPGGDRIAYTTHTSGCSSPDCYAVVQRSADGTGRVDTLLRGGAAPVFSRDGRHILATRLLDGFSKWDIVAVALEGDRHPVTLVHGNMRVTHSEVSPNGQFLAYMSDESGDWQVYLTRFPGGDGRWQVSTDGGSWPQWNASGDRLYYARENDILEVEVSGATAPTLGAPKVLLTRPIMRPMGFAWDPSFSVTEDGNRFAVLKSQGGAGERTGVTVVQNWFAEFAGKK